MVDKNKESNTQRVTFESVTGGLSQEDLYGLMCDMRELSEMGVTGNQGVLAEGLPHVVRPGNMANGGLRKEITISTYDGYPNEGGEVVRRTTFSAFGMKSFDIAFEDIEHGTILDGKSDVPFRDATSGADYESVLWFVPKDQWVALGIIRPDVARQKAEAIQARQQRGNRWRILGRSR